MRQELNKFLDGTDRCRRDNIEGETQKLDQSVLNASND